MAWDLLGATYTNIKLAEAARKLPLTCLDLQQLDRISKSKFTDTPGLETPSPSPSLDFDLSNHNTAVQGPKLHSRKSLGFSPLT